MNISTIIALIVILALFIPAARYLYKYGACGSCPDRGGCSGHCTTGKFKDKGYKEKSVKIDEIMKKHGM